MPSPTVCRAGRSLSRGPLRPPFALFRTPFCVVYIKTGDRVPKPRKKKKMHMQWSCFFEIFTPIPLQPATAPATGPRSGVVLPHTPNRLTHSRTHGSRAWDRDRFRREGVRLRGPCCHDLGCEITVSLKMQSRKTGGRGKGLRRGRTVGMVAARCDMPRVRVEASDRVVRVRNITAGRAGS